MPQANDESTDMLEAARLEILCNVLAPRSQKRRLVLILNVTSCVTIVMTAPRKVKAAR